MTDLIYSSDEGGDGSDAALEIACQAPETAEPGKGAFDDPALGPGLRPGKPNFWPPRWQETLEVGQTPRDIAATIRSDTAPNIG
jgi:hypothetical protein